jgi:transposase
MMRSMLMTAVMIGIDPHKGSHTAVAITAAEEPLAELRIRASASQAGRLVAWAQAWPERTWAVEGAGGLGHLLAQQLVAVGERVLDVQPKLAARVRLLEAGDTNKNDPNDALSVAVAALRSRARRQVAADDHAAVLKVWSKRHRDLARSRNQVACRLHAVLCELRPGGFAKEITAGQVARILEQTEPSGAVALARHELAGEFLADLRHLDAQLRDTKKKLAAAVRASGTSVTEVFGIGPGQRRHHHRRRHRHDPVRQPGPVRRLQRHRPDRGVVGKPEDLPPVAARQPAHQPRHPHGRDHPDPPPAQRRPRLLRQEDRRGQDHKEALRALKRRISNAVFARLQADARRAAAAAGRGSGGQPGNDSVTSAADSHPEHRLFGQATPEPDTTLRPATPARRKAATKATSSRTRRSP